ncbi:MAG: UvrD-helicase domain-containing protein [Erysipelotrichaceae bacterium]|nr:UvrD-helicase domain-containing protein [Erysipelotrichaceae bacterium]
MNCTIPKKQILNKPFCKKFNMKKSYIDTTVNTYNNFEKLIDEKNERFIQKEMVKEKDYLDNVLKSVDPVIDLDENQRRVVLSDEDYTLVIAGAGAGKTTTVAAKVKYLVDKKDTDHKKILVIHLLTRPLPLSP